MSGVKVLIDTNVLIYREDDRVISENLQELHRQLRTDGHDILIHPMSKKEIQNDTDSERREKAESKIATYPVLEYPPFPRDADEPFRDAVGHPTNPNDQIDDALLYTVYKDTVDFLVTEDEGIHRKARRLGLEDRVFTIEEGRNYFAEEPPEVRGPPSIKRVRVRDLDPDDLIFDTLKEEYPDFEGWLARKGDRSAYISQNPDDSLGAVLILKPNEFEEIGYDPPLGKEERLKISTMKVAKDRRGQKIGELLLSIAFREAMHHGNEEVYLTHFPRNPDYLIDLIFDYGFKRKSTRRNGEGIYVKRLTPGLGDDPSPIDTAHDFYPSFYDGTRVKKFLIPINPEFHDRLFPSYRQRQSQLMEFSGEFIPEGNAIKKAYLCHSPTRQIDSADLLLFYRTNPEMELTSVGVCESAKYGMTDPEEITRRVRRRTVYSDEEIGEMASKPTTVILFQWHFHLENPIAYSELLENDILSGYLQSITEIEESNYKYIKNVGRIDERFTID